MRTSLTRHIGVMRRDEPALWSREDFIRFAREVRDDHNIVVLRRSDLNALQLGAVDAVADQVIGKKRSAG